MKGESNTHKIYADNVLFVLEKRNTNLPQIAGKAGKERGLRYNVDMREKQPRRPRIDTIEKTAKRLCVPVWALFLPNLPQIFDHIDELERIIAGFALAENETKSIIDKLIARDIERNAST